MSSPIPANPLDSPCIGICALDDEGLCLGCRRQIGEIAAWSRLDTEQRRRILALLPARKHPKEQTP